MRMEGMEDRLNRYLEENNISFLMMEMLLNNTTHKIKILDVHVNKQSGGIKRYDKRKQDCIQYFKAWNASFDYKGRT